MKAISESQIAEVAVDAEDLLASSAAGPAAVRGGAIRALTFLGGTVISTAAAALLYRHLGAVETGHYAIAMSLGAVVTGLTDLGLTAVGMRELAVLKGSERESMARNLLGMRLALTVAGVLVTVGFAFLVYGQLLGLGVLISGVGVLVQNTQTTLAVPLMASLRLGWVSSLDLARQIIIAALVVLFVLLGARLLPFLTTAGIAAAVVLVPTALLVRGMIPIRASFQRAEWRAMLAPVLTYSAAAAAGVLYFRVAIVIVSLIAGKHEIGYYGLSFRIVEVLFTVPAIVVSAAFPIFARAARDDPARLQYALSRVFEVSLLAGAGLALSIGVGAHFAVEVVGGSKFLPAAPILAVQGVGLGASFVGAVWAYGMLSLHLHRMILIYNLSMVALLSCLVLLFTAIDGAEGAAIGTACAEVAGSVLGAVVLIRRHPYLAMRLTIVPKVAFAALFGIAPAFATGIPDVARMALAMMIFSVALLALRALPPELLALVPAQLRRAR